MDLQYIKVTAVDNKGIPVENFDGVIDVEMEGMAKIVALDNGDHFTERNFEATSTSLYKGSALIILRSSRDQGNVNVKVSVNGLKPVKANLRTI